MTYSDRYLEKFGALSVFKQTCLIVLTAVIGADTLTLIFYSIFFADRLILDLVLTAVITIAISFPLGYFFMGQQVKLTMMATRLDRAARIDDLTKLANRKTFFDGAHALMQQASAETVVGAVLFIDADHFKSINDTFGHSVGDAVLRELGRVIRCSLRDGDLGARIGGEEFAVFLVGADHGEAMQVAERVRSETRGVARAAGIADREITVSVGVSVCRPGQALEDILLQADRNLYAAKNKGRDCIVAARPKLAVA